MSNKRKNDRYQCIVPVDGKDGSSFAQTKTVNISKGGLGFVSHQRIPINKRIAIELDLFDENEPVVVIGRVRWVKTIGKSENYRIGLAFEEVISGSQSRINQYFKK